MKHGQNLRRISRGGRVSCPTCLSCVSNSSSVDGLTDYVYVAEADKDSFLARFQYKGQVNLDDVYTPLAGAYFDAIHDNTRFGAEVGRTVKRTVFHLRILAILTFVVVLLVGTIRVGVKSDWFLPCTKEQSPMSDQKAERFFPQRRHRQPRPLQKRLSHLPHNPSTHRRQSKCGRVRLLRTSFVRRRLSLPSTRLAEGLIEGPADQPERRLRSVASGCRQDRRLVIRVACARRSYHHKHKGTSDYDKENPRQRKSENPPQYGHSRKRKTRTNHGFQD